MAAKAERRRERFTQQAPSAVNCHFACKASVAELQRLSPIQLKAFMSGVGQVLSAQKGGEVKRG